MLLPWAKWGFYSRIWCTVVYSIGEIPCYPYFTTPQAQTMSDSNVGSGLESASYFLDYWFVRHVAAYRCFEQLNLTGGSTFWQKNSNMPYVVRVTYRDLMCDRGVYIVVLDEGILFWLRGMKLFIIEIGYGPNYSTTDDEIHECRGHHVWWWSVDMRWVMTNYNCGLRICNLAGLPNRGVTCLVVCKTAGKSGGRYQSQIFGRLWRLRDMRQMMYRRVKARLSII